MKLHKNPHKKGVTLIELTVVISVILTLISTTFYGVSYWRDWSKGLAAGEDLKSVYQAQKLFLADNPTTVIANITSADITPYLPNGMTAIPTVTDLDGGARTITITVSPPVLSGGYDPMPPSDNSMWDAGK